MLSLVLAAVVARAAQSVPTWIKVGDDGIYVADVSYPYTFPSSGAVLNRTQSGYRLDLNGILIRPGAFEGSSIRADGDLSICLEGENFIEGGSSAGIYLSSTRTCSHNLTIFGTGKLTVMADSSSFLSHGIYAGDDISIMAGATVSVYGGGAGGGSFAIWECASQRLHGWGVWIVWMCNSIRRQHICPCGDAFRPDDRSWRLCAGQHCRGCGDCQCLHPFDLLFKQGFLC